MNFQVRHKFDHRRTMVVGEDFLKYNPDWEWTTAPPRPRAKTTAEIWRTVASVASVVIQTLVLLRVFGVI